MTTARGYNAGWVLNVGPHFTRWRSARPQVRILPMAVILGPTGSYSRPEREPITEVWGQSPQRGPGAEPMVRRFGGEAPQKLKAFFVSGPYTEQPRETV